MTLTRRRMFSASASLALALAGAAGALLAPPWRQAKADAGMPDPADLAKAGPDGDVVLGSDKAPVTIIEYASMTCPHCAHFSENTFPELQSATSIPARCASSSASFRSMPCRSGLHAGTLRRQGQIHPGGRDAVRQTARMDGGKTDRAAARHRQAIRLHQPEFRRMPGQSEAIDRHPRGGCSASCWPRWACAKERSKLAAILWTGDAFGSAHCYVCSRQIASGRL